MAGSRALSQQALKGKSSKHEREREVLLRLVSYYIRTGKPVGSETLKEVEFPQLSSATIRNYFQNLEADGFLMQHHTSSGRFPTAKAFRLYARVMLDMMTLKKGKASDLIQTIEVPQDIREVALVMQDLCENVAERSGCACFLSSPRFDQDFVVDIKLVAFETGRCLSILLTNFGAIHTEVLNAPRKLSQHDIKKFESYFHSRLSNGTLEPEPLTSEEFELAQRFYQESMARYLVNYSNFSQEEVLRAGFSKMLRYPEFHEVESLASSLSLFENDQALMALIRDTMRSRRLKFWIGEDLFSFLSSAPICSVVAIPYQIGPKFVGALGLIGPMRMPYLELFQLLTQAREALSKYLTDNLYKHKIGFRTTLTAPLELDYQEHALLAVQKPFALLEDKGKK